MRPSGFRIEDVAAAMRFWKVFDGTDLVAPCGPIVLRRHVVPAVRLIVLDGRPAHEARSPLGDIFEPNLAPAFAVQRGFSMEPPPP